MGNPSDSQSSSPWTCRLNSKQFHSVADPPLLSGANAVSELLLLHSVVSFANDSLEKNDSFKVIRLKGITS